jgi:hypothetical protein
MAEDWQHQIRLVLEEMPAALARRDPGNPALRPLTDALGRSGATLLCQLDAFAGFVAEVEQTGAKSDPLYSWTKATLQNPKKVERYLRSFTVYVGGNSVYDKAVADRLESDLKPLIGGGIVERLARHDTNPANNPQPPQRFQS